MTRLIAIFRAFETKALVVKRFTETAHQGGITRLPQRHVPSYRNARRRQIRGR